MARQPYDFEEVALDEDNRDRLIGMMTALTMVVTQLVEKTARVETNPREWLEETNDQCLRVLVEVARSIQGTDGSATSIEAASDLIVRIFSQPAVK